MEQGLKDKIERMRAKAELFLNNDIRAFIVDINNNYYFCDILLVGENHITFYNFAGKRKGEKDRLLWLDISDIEEYKEENELKNEVKKDEDS